MPALSDWSFLTPIGVLVPLGAFAMVTAIFWLANRRKEAVSSHERDVHLAFLARFTTTEEMTKFLNTPEGSRFVEYLGKPRGLDPRQQLIDYLTGGIVTAFIGVAMIFVAQVFPLLIIPGSLTLAVGLALLVAACLAYPIARRLGLVTTAASERK